METNTIYIVQAYSERYEFWGDTQEPVDGLFSFPIVGYDTEGEGPDAPRRAHCEVAQHEVPARQARDDRRGDLNQRSPGVRSQIGARTQCGACRRSRLDLWEWIMTKEKLELRYYKRMWIVVTVATVIGLGLTVTLNVMHAPPTLGARLVGGTPPLFVLLCLELISRIPATSRLLSGARVFASIVVVGLSFAISYEQQREFVQSLGFEGWIAYAFPVIIDGAMVVSTLSLVEVTRKVRLLRPMVEAQADPAPARPVVVTPEIIKAEQAGQAFREAAERLRQESTVAALNGKPVAIPMPAESAA